MRLATIFGAISTLTCVTADILSIDLGSQFFKVALVSTGKFDIVPNLQSKRKTPTALSFKQKLREFGDDALLAQIKSPSKVPTLFRWLIGANLTETDPEILYQSDFVPPFQVSVDETRKSPLFGNDELDPRPVEELLAHILWYAKNLVEEHDTTGSGKAKIGSLKDLVITVPSWATRRQRQAIIDAANVAGFLRVTLVHETSSGAVQRSFDMGMGPNTTTEVNTMYLNAGAGHFEACVIKYGLTNPNISSSAPTARVLGCSYSLKAGGFEITTQLAREGAAAFLKKHPKLDAKAFNADPIPRIRLFRQAESAKQTLSANKETLLSVESLYEETDLKMPVSRSDIERISKPMLTEIESVIEKAIVKSGLTRDELHQVEVIGGAWRVPFIQAKLEEYFAPIPMGQHLNGDEAMVFGGAFIAANSSSSFRVRKVLFTDVIENEYSITITPATVPAGEESKWPRTQVIFPTGQKLNSVKAIKLSVDSDLTVEVAENGNLIERISVTGRNESDPSPAQIVVKVKIDGNGVFSVSAGEAVYEHMVEQLVKAPTVISVSGNTTDNSSVPEFTKVMVPKKVKVPLKLTTLFEAAPLSMTADQIKAASGVLKAAAEAESAIKLRTKTKNDLEALVYSMRDKMEDNLEVRDNSDEDERNHVVTVSREVENWLDDNGYAATVDEFKNQIHLLKQAAKPIFDRIAELKKRIEAEELMKKLQAEMERLAKLNETAAANETEGNSTEIPELDELNLGEEGTAGVEEEGTAQTESPKGTVDPSQDEL